MQITRPIRINYPSAFDFRHLTAGDRFCASSQTTRAANALLQCFNDSLVRSVFVAFRARNCYNIAMEKTNVSQPSEQYASFGLGRRNVFMWLASLFMLLSGALRIVYYSSSVEDAEGVGSTAFVLFLSFCRSCSAFGMLLRSFQKAQSGFSQPALPYFSARHF